MFVLGWNQRAALSQQALILELFSQPEQCRKAGGDDGKSHAAPVKLQKTTAVISFLLCFCHIFRFDHTLPPLLVPSVPSSTKALPHPSTSRAYSSAATTVSACALSGSARMLLS